MSELGATISVPVPGRARSLSAGSNIPFSTARSRCSTNPFRSSHGPGWTSANLYLDDTILRYELQNGQKCEILLEDLLGVHISPTPLLSDGRACQMDIHMFPVITKKFTKKKIRKMADISLLFDQEKIFVDNLKLASEWKEQILSQVDIATQEAFEQGDVDIQNGHSNGHGTPTLGERKPRKFVVFINPMAGVQRGESEFYTCVKPMFDVAEIDYEVKVTNHQNHAHDMIQTMDLSSVDGIVMGSGDGLLYEVINGIMKRPDWEKIIKIPVGMLPLGSGNALVASTLYEANELFSLETAAFQIIRGGYSPLDLTTIHTSDGRKCYMSLLGAWGLVADVDIESEKMRKIGDIRFFLGTMNAIRKKKVYRGRLSYLVPDDSNNKPHAMAVDRDLLDAPETDCDVVNDESISSDVSPEDVSPHTVAKNKPVDSKSSSVQSCATEEDQTSVDDCHRISQDVAGCSGGGESKIDYLTVQQSIHSEFPQPPTNLLMPLSSPVPETWISMEGDYLNISMLTIPFLSRTSIGDSSLEIGSGKIRIVWIDGAATRFETLKVFANSETGRHVEMDQVKVIDAVAFRIEPTTPDGIMTVDGEQISYGPIQGQVHPHMCSVMSRKRKK